MTRRAGAVCLVYVVAASAGGVAAAEPATTDPCRDVPRSCCLGTGPRFDPSSCPAREVFQPAQLGALQACLAPRIDSVMRARVWNEPWRTVHLVQDIHRLYDFEPQLERLVIGCVRLGKTTKNCIQEKISEFERAADRTRDEDERRAVLVGLLRQRVCIDDLALATLPAATALCRESAGSPEAPWCMIAPQLEQRARSMRTYLVACVVLGAALLLLLARHLFRGQDPW